MGAIATVTVVGGFVAGCGGSSESSQSGGSTPTNSTSQAETTNQSETKSDTNSTASGPEPSKEFVGSGANGRLAKIGKESSVAEREAASQVLQEYFQAREEGDWAGQCALLAASMKEQIENSVSLGSSVPCPAALKSQAQGLPIAVRANTMTGPIDAFRINEAINGFAFWHGTRGKDYVIPLIKQEGWKVVALTTEVIPP